MHNKIISIEDVSISYGHVEIIKNISLDLDSNKIIGLCGPNGAGKTTLIKMIVGLLRDFKGNITVDNNEISYISKSLISYQPDIITLDPNLNGKKALKQYKSLYKDFDEERFSELLIKLKLPNDKPLKKMSKGMKEKFQLALTLSRRAKVYIFDEPIAGVDPASRDSILETIINNYTKDALLLISTHLIQDIESILDEVVFINDGEIVLHENCDDLREKSNMSIDQLFREEFKW